MQSKASCQDTSPVSVSQLSSGRKPSRSSMAPQIQDRKAATKRRASMIPKLTKTNEEDICSKSKKRPSDFFGTGNGNSTGNGNENCVPAETFNHIPQKPTIEGNAKRRRVSLLEVQTKINAVMDQVGDFEEVCPSKSMVPQRRRSLRISLLAANQHRNDVDWIDI